MPVLTAEEQQSQFLLEVPDWTRISQLLRDCLIKLHSYHHPPLEDVFSPLNKAHILALQASSGLVTPQSSGESCVVTKSHTLSDNQLSSKPQISKQTGECVDTQIFEGIIQFLTNEYSDANRGEFLTDLLPALLNRALEFEELRKKYLSRRGCVGYRFCTSIICCGILGLLPSTDLATPYLAVTKFNKYIQHLRSPSSCPKLQCLLGYLRWLTSDSTGTAEEISFYRETGAVEPLSEWLMCNSPLCDITVQPASQTAYTGPAVIQVVVPDKLCDGDASDVDLGATQPGYPAENAMTLQAELLAGLLVVEDLGEDDVFLVTGLPSWGRGCHGYTEHSKPPGSHTKSTIGIIDMQGAGSNVQHGRQEIVKGLNKAHISFRSLAGGPDSPWEDEVWRKQREESVTASEDFFSAAESLPEEPAPSLPVPELVSLSQHLSENIMNEAIQITKDSYRQSHAAVAENVLTSGISETEPAPSSDDAVCNVCVGRQSSDENAEARLCKLQERDPDDKGSLDGPSKPTEKMADCNNMPACRTSQPDVRPKEKVPRGKLKPKPTASRKQRDESIPIPVHIEFSGEESGHIAIATSSKVCTRRDRKRKSLESDSVVPAGQEQPVSMETAAGEVTQDPVKFAEHFTASILNQVASISQKTSGCESHDATVPVESSGIDSKLERPSGKGVQFASKPFEDNLTDDLKLMYMTKRPEDGRHWSDSLKPDTSKAMLAESHDLGKGKDIPDDSPAFLSMLDSCVNDWVTIAYTDAMAEVRMQVCHVSSSTENPGVEKEDIVTCVKNLEEKVDGFKQDVEEYVSNMLQDTFDEVFFAVRERMRNISQFGGRARSYYTCSDKALDEEWNSQLFAFVDDFILNILEEALFLFKTQYHSSDWRNRHSRKKSGDVLLLRQRSHCSEMPEGGARRLEPSSSTESAPNADDSDVHSYFEAEFSFDGSRGPDSYIRRRTSTMSSSASRQYLRPGSSTSSRRGSYDDDGKSYSGRYASSAGFKDLVLSDFEDELVHSEVSASSVGNLFPGEQEIPFSELQRRASAPASRWEDDDSDLVLQGPPAKKRAASVDSTASRKLILDWLEDRRSSSSGQSSSSRRQNSTTHLDWFAQDLLVDAFNDAFVYLFGENYDTTEFNKAPSDHFCSQPAGDDDDSVSLSVSSHAPPHASTNDIPDDIQRYVHDLTTRILQDSFTELQRRSFCEKDDFCDALDVPFGYVQHLGELFAEQILQEAIEILQRQREEPAIAQHHPGPDAVVYPCTVFGDWGCRTRDRDTQLRAVLQWVGASRAGLPGIQYCTGDGPQGKQFTQLAGYLRAQGTTVGQLVKVILEFIDKPQESVDILDYIVHRLLAKDHGDKSSVDSLV